MDTYHILVDCPDEKGIIYNISKIIFEHGLNIEQQSEFVDQQSKHFFLRTEVQGILPNNFLDEIKGGCPELANIRIFKFEKKKVVILAGKEGHCLGDLLLRHDSGELNFDILTVISNHEVLRPLVEKFDVPFVHIPVGELSREEHEELLKIELDKYQSDFIVLAKYMRVLTRGFVETYAQKIVNIHHSFLPAFIGAKPYHQAYKRGVKMIGATSHFVTEQLDEGPIIAQDVSYVNHSKSPEELIWAGRNIEKIVLAKTLRLLCQNRVFIRSNRTVVFD